MADDFLTREQFIAQYGVDPEQQTAPVAAPAPAAKGLPSLGNAVRDVGVGAATALTDVLALPGVVSALGGAAYDAVTSDAKFGPSLAKRLRVDDAEQRTERHLMDVVNEARAQVPNLSEQEARQVLNDYTSSKGYEDFQRSLIKNSGVRAAQNIKEAARDIAGDERTDKERSWTDSALEILGGSLVGIGPQGVATIGGRLGRTAAGRVLANSPVVYNTARILELVTPLTLPLTPANVALNTSVGVALDQGLRYATGDTTALDNNDSGLAGIAAVATATGVGAAAIGALRGRAAAVAQGASGAPPMSPALEQAVKSGAEGGAAFKAGDFADYGNRPTPALGIENQGIVQATRNAATRYISGGADEFSIARSMLNDIGGKELADWGETTFSNYSGAGGVDRAYGEANNLMRELNRSFKALSPELQEEVRISAPMYQAETRLLKDEAVTRAEIADLQAQQNMNGLTPVQAKQLADLQDALRLRTADDPATRRFFPELSRSDIQQRAEFFRTSPELKQFRDTLEHVNTQFLNDAVREGRLSPADAQAMKKDFPLYMPLQQDAFDGATGASRVVKSFLAAMDPAKRERVVNQAKANTFKTYDAGIDTNPEGGRITSPQDPMLALSVYFRNAYTDLYANNARREILRALTKDAQGNPTKFVQDGNIQVYTDRNGRSAFTNAEIRAANGGRGNPALQAMMEAEDTIAVRTNGATTFYRLGDPALAQLLRFDPTQYHGIVWLAKHATDMFKMNTTGVLAPPFAVANAIYDTTLGNVLKKPDRAFGPLDTFLRKFMSDSVARHTLGRSVDPTSFVALPWHVVAGIGEVAAAHAARYLANDMAQQGPMQAIAKSLGAKNYQALVQRMLLAAERSKTIQMLDKGIAHSGGLSDMPHALNAFTAAANLVPAGVRNTYQFWKDMVSSVHAAPKRQFYAQNYSLLERKYGGAANIPQKEIEKLIFDTRALAGDMTRRSNYKTVQELEAMVPYMAPARNGVTAMARSLTDPQAAAYAWPRLMMMMSGTMATFYIMSTWDDNAKKEFWLNTPEWMRYRYLFVPRPDVLAAWSRGENVPYSNDKVYKIPIGPDLAPFIAGSAAFLRGIGVLPNGPIDTAASGLSDMWKMAKDMLPISMPPAFNAILATQGAELDLSGADARGGNAIRMLQGNPFRKGPQDEAASPLGETSTLSARLMAILFGANGAYLAKSGDALQHATNYDATKVDGKGLATPRVTPDYAAGLRAATTTFMEAQQKRLPDVPLLWKSDDKQYTSTSASAQVAEAKNHIQSITGMRNFAQGKTTQGKREQQAAEGGVVQRFLRDPVLLQVADTIAAWDRGGQKLGPEVGRYAELKKEYSSLAAQRRAIDSSYNMPPATRKEKSNALIDRMQENMDQQRMAVMWMEQQLTEKYGPALAPRLNGRALTMQSLDQMMREAVRE